MQLCRRTERIKWRERIKNEDALKNSRGKESHEDA